MSLDVSELLLVCSGSTATGKASWSAFGEAGSVSVSIFCPEHNIQRFSALGGKGLRVNGVDACVKVCIPSLLRDRPVRPIA